jgi:phosphoglycolate phosphatase-like HAD superfamily hydrolase
MTDTILNKREAIAFDLDGTLISIEKRDYSVYCVILKKYNLKILDFETYWALRREKEPIINILKINNHIENSFLDTYINERNKLIESKELLELDTLFSYSIEVLQKLQNRYNCYLVTSRTMKLETIQQIDQLNLNKYFNKIIITEQNKLEGFSQIPNLLLIVGDTENDLIPADLLGVKSYAVTSGIRSLKFLENLNPTYLNNSLLNLFNYI